MGSRKRGRRVGVRRATDGRRRLAIAGAVAAVAVLAFVVARPMVGPARAAVRHVTDVTRVETHAELLRVAAAEFDLDPNFMAGLMLAESGGRVAAVSRVDALGLFQLRLSTARDMAARMGIDEPDRDDLLEDGALNARLAARYLVWLAQQFDGDREKMLIAYNAGPSRLNGWIREAGGWETWRDERRAAGDSTVLAYVDKVLRYREVFAKRGRITPVSGSR